MIREVLVDGRNPRHIAALAPVVVAQIRQISLSKLWSEFAALGLERRLGWALENTSEALKVVSKLLDSAEAQLHRQTDYERGTKDGDILYAPPVDEAVKD